MIEVVVYRSGNKIKSKTCRTPHGYFSSSNTELHDIIRDYPDSGIVFKDRKSGEDVTFIGLLGVIRTAEMDSTSGAKIDLTRVIRNGGFSEYIRKLEANKRR